MHILSLSILLATARALLVPSPPGPYSVATKDLELIDETRIDPLAPSPNTKRRFMASAYLPIDPKHACEPEIVPYMPAATAKVFGEVGATLGIPQGMLEVFDMDFCNISSFKLDVDVAKEEFPVVVFSPGFGGSRFLYGAMARSLASLGHIVFTVDHTYETYAVEFPDGSVANGSIDPTALDLDNSTQVLELLEVRTSDISFLATQLSNKTLTSTLLANFPGTLNPQHLAIYGHSLGGATAAVAVQQNPLIIGGLNFDGTIFGPVAHEGFKNKPFVLVASTRNATNNSLPALPGWDEFYDEMDGEKMWLAVRETQHYAFMDVPLLLTVFDLPDAERGMVEGVFGTLDGMRLEEVVNEVMSGLAELLFGNETGALEGLGRNGDVVVVRSDLEACA